MDDFVIKIPDDMDYYTCDVGTLVILDRVAELFFTSIVVDQELFVSDSFCSLMS